MRKIALVTCRKIPKLSDDDRLLLPSLKNHGFETNIVIWNDKTINWQKYDVVVLRSTWDYYLHINNFYHWLNKLEKYKIRVFNPIDIIRWNLNKAKYFKDLNKKGVSIVPTTFVKNLSDKPVNSFYDKYQCDQIVVKPIFGASGFNVQKYKLGQKIKDINPPFLIQPFMKEIYNGEYSFVFISDKYSHTVLKKPKKNEYRANYEFGAKASKVNLPLHLKRQAEKIYKKLNFSLLYARLDMLKVNDKLILSELELIEPFLFFGLRKEAANIFIDALTRLSR